jgi:hypothetical protein
MGGFMNLLKTTITSLALLSAVSATANFSQATLKGSGCLPGTFSKVFSPDGKEVSILFDELSVEVPFEKEVDLPGFDPIVQTRQLKRCVMNFKVKVPAGKRLVKIKFKNDYRGFAFGEDGTTADIDSRLISWKQGWGGTQRKSDILFKKQWGDLEFDREIETSKTKTINVNQSCSDSNKEIEFAVKNDIKAEILDAPYGADFDELPSASLILDSNDVSGNFKVKMVTEDCSTYGGGDDDYTRPTRPTRPGRIDHQTRRNMQKCRAIGGKWNLAKNTCEFKRRHRSWY